MPETQFPEDAFALFSNFNRSKIEGNTDEYWSKAEWPISEIEKLLAWAKDPATPKVENFKNEKCVVVAQKLLPRTAKSGNSYYMGVTSGKKEEMPF